MRPAPGLKRHVPLFSSAARTIVVCKLQSRPADCATSTSSPCEFNQPEATAVETQGQLLHPALLVDQRSQLQTCDGHADIVHQLAQIIAGDKPDSDRLLIGAELRKPELLVQARLVLLDSQADPGAKRDALLLLQWCAAEQPLAPAVKVKEEVQYYTSLAQHSRSPLTKQWASVALIMLAGQPATQLLVIGDEDSAQVLTSLMREALMQPSVQLHILAQCARLIALVTSLPGQKRLPGQEQLLQLCIRQLTEPLLRLLLGEGGATAAEACGALVALMKAQPKTTAAAINASAAAAEGEGAKTNQCGVAAVVAALERELGELAPVSPAVVKSKPSSGAAAAETPGVEDSAVSKEAGDEADPAAGKGSVSVASGSEGQGQQEDTTVGQQPPSRGGQPLTSLAASLLALLRRLLVLEAANSASITVSNAAIRSVLAYEGTVSLLVRCLQLGSQEQGADAMCCLANLLRDPQARDRLLAAEGAVDEVASHCHLAPATTARALWHMREHLKSIRQCEALLQLLGRPAPSTTSSDKNVQRYGDALECVKTMVVAGRWGSWDQPGAASPALLAAPSALLSALDLVHGHLDQLTSGCAARRTLMELWALLSSNPETALQLALRFEAAADGAASSLPCCVSAAMHQLQQAAPLPPAASLRSQPQRAAAPLQRPSSSSSLLSPHLALLLNLLRAACAQHPPPSWVRQLRGSFFTILLQHLLAPAAPEAVDLQALQLCTRLCDLCASDPALGQPPLQLTPQMLLRNTSRASDPQAQSGAARGDVEWPWPAAAWSPLDVLQAKLGLMQRVLPQGPAAGDSSVLPLLLKRLVTGPLADDAPLPLSEYSPLLGATPDSMRCQVLQLVRQALPMGSRPWVRDELQRALDAASSCKAGQPRKQELANCVALASLWLDLQLQGDMEQMDDQALELHLRSLQDRLQDMVPWVLKLLPLLMGCPAAAKTPVPSTAAPAPSVLQASWAILELASLHSTISSVPLQQQPQAQGLTPLATHRWVLRELAAATVEGRSRLAAYTSTWAVQAAKKEHAAQEVAEAREQMLKAWADAKAANAALSTRNAQIKKMQNAYAAIRDGIIEKGVKTDQDLLLLLPEELV